MEEKTKKEGKVSDAGRTASQGDGQQSQRYTYEQLNHIAGELSAQNSELRSRLAEAERYIDAAQTANVFKYLEALQRVIDGSVMYSDEFVGSCADRVDRIITALDALLMPPASEDAEKSESSDGDVDGQAE